MCLLQWLIIYFCWHSVNKRSMRLNALRPRQNCCHFADDSFKCIFLNENVWIALKISLKFVPKVQINNIPVLVQVGAWSATSHFLNQWRLVYWRIYAPLGLNELTNAKSRNLFSYSLSFYVPVLHWVYHTHFINLDMFFEMINYLLLLALCQAAFQTS